MPGESERVVPCDSCMEPMEEWPEDGPNSFLCEDCDRGAEVNLWVAGMPVVVEFFGVEYGAPDAH